MGSSARMRPGRRGERAADGDALLLAAGELLGVAGEEVGEAEARGQLGLPGGVEAAGEAGLEGEVGGDVEARDQVELLEDEADGAAAELGAGGVGEGGDLGAVDLDGAGVDGVEAGDEVEERALAAARFAGEREASAGGEGERDAAEDRDRALGGRGRTSRPGRPVSMAGI